uniref:GAF domain-containing protein n=1 Tax=Euplotes harpa TaxID=151035 RepID=A0A7S3J7C4_9SPIT
MIACMQMEFKNRRGNTEKDINNSNIDLVIFKIFNMFLQMKVNSLFADISRNFKEKHLYDTISLASRITTQRSFKQLIGEIKLLLPEYFGFESVGILLLDTKTKDLFTIAYIQKDEKVVGEGAEYAESSDIISFPSTLGITGLVFQTGEVYICNQATTDRKFMADIDNLSSIIEVDNFMIGPIFNDKKSSPVGIVQLMNK